MFHSQGRASERFYPNCPRRYERSTHGPRRVHSCAAGRGRLSTRAGFCAALGKSEPAREDTSPPTAVQRHTIILEHHRILVPRSNAERRSLARVPEPTPHGRLRPTTPRLQKMPLSRLPFKRTVATLSSHHDIHITSPHHYILHRTHRPT